jgi:Mg-chelatase subunit ChlD
MKRWSLLTIALTLLLIGAVCTEDEAYLLLSGQAKIASAERESVDYVIVLDRSGSMGNGKLEEAREAMKLFVETAEGDDRVGVVSFDSRPLTHHRLSSNKDSLKRAINRIPLGDWTRYVPALLEAQSLLEDGKSVIVFVSDGRPDEPYEDVMSVVLDLVENSVCIHTIAYADSADEEAQRVMREMAALSLQRTGCGGYHRALDHTFELQEALTAIYREVSAEDLISVAVDVEQDDEYTVFRPQTTGYAGQSLLGTCFSPVYEYQVLHNNQLIREYEGPGDFRSRLPAGEFEYYVIARETCGGNCYFTGRARDVFNVSSDKGYCDSTWDQLRGLVMSTQYVEVHITATGFSPQTVGAQGIVAWKNLDDRPHRVVAQDGNFASPVIPPGGTWSLAFPAGNYAYTNPLGNFTGQLRGAPTGGHQPIDLVLVLDRSGSMSDHLITQAKSAAHNLLSVLEPGDRAALITFSTRAQLEQALTNDIALLNRAVDGVRSDGSTFYIEPLQLSREQLRYSDRHQLVIFLSDGVPYDIGGEPAILRAVDSLGSACLYAIGYAEEGLDAIDILSKMAERSRRNTGCGEFFYSTADKDLLSGIFGEIYASMQEPSLDLYDLRVESENGAKRVSVKVRSRINGAAVPSTSQFGCIPQAEVYAVFGSERFLLTYDGTKYSGLVELPRGSYQGSVTARLQAPEDPVRSIVGSTPLNLRVQQRAWWWLLVVLAIGGLTVKFLIATRRSRQDARAY